MVDVEITVSPDTISAAEPARSFVQDAGIGLDGIIFDVDSDRKDSAILVGDR